MCQKKHCINNNDLDKYKVLEEVFLHQKRTVSGYCVFIWCI